MALSSRFIRNLAFSAAMVCVLFPTRAQVASASQPIQIRVKTIPSRINIKTPEVFKIELVNTALEDVWVYKETWHCGGLSIEIFDSKGKPLKPRGHWGLPPPPPNPSDFLSLKPGESLSTTSPGNLFDLGVKKPGKYSAIVYYFHHVGSVDSQLVLRLSQAPIKSESVEFRVQ